MCAPSALPATSVRLSPRPRPNVTVVSTAKLVKACVQSVKPVIIVFREARRQTHVMRARTVQRKAPSVHLALRGTTVRSIARRRCHVLMGTIVEWGDRYARLVPRGTSARMVQRRLFNAPQVFTLPVVKIRALSAHKVIIASLEQWLRRSAQVGITVHSNPAPALFVRLATSVRKNHQVLRSASTVITAQRVSQPARFVLKATTVKRDLTHRLCVRWAPSVRLAKTLAPSVMPGTTVQSERQLRSYALGAFTAHLASRFAQRAKLDISASRARWRLHPVILGLLVNRVHQRAKTAPLATTAFQQQPNHSIALLAATARRAHSSAHLVLKATAVLFITRLPNCALEARTVHRDRTTAPFVLLVTSAPQVQARQRSATGALTVMKDRAKNSHVLLGTSALKDLRRL